MSSPSPRNSNFFSSETGRGTPGLELALEAGLYLAVLLVLWLVFSTQIVAPLNEVLSGLGTVA